MNTTLNFWNLSQKEIGSMTRYDLNKTFLGNKAAPLVDSAEKNRIRLSWRKARLAEVKRMKEERIANLPEDQFICPICDEVDNKNDGSYRFCWKTNQETKELICIPCGENQNDAIADHIAGHDDWGEW